MATTIVPYYTKALSERNHAHALCMIRVLRTLSDNCNPLLMEDRALFDAVATYVVPRSGNLLCSVTDLCKSLLPHVEDVTIFRRVLEHMVGVVLSSSSALTWNPRVGGRIRSWRI